MPVGQTISRALARSVIPKFFAQGYSASAALKEFGRIGPGLRKTLWLSDWREITGAKKLARAYRFIPRKYALSYSLMAPTETFQNREYKYVFDTHTRNLETGELMVKTQSMGTDKRLSLDEAEQKWEQTLDDEMGMCSWAGVMEILNVEVKVVYRRVH